MGWHRGGIYYCGLFDLLPAVIDVDGKLQLEEAANRSIALTGFEMHFNSAERFGKQIGADVTTDGRSGTSAHVCFSNKSQ